MMRDTRYIFLNEHFALYKSSVDASEPLEDFDDRNALYAMFVSLMLLFPSTQNRMLTNNRRHNLINSGLHVHRAYLRET